MAKLQNDRLLRAIWHEPVDKTPVWIMRQAGRYLPEYRQVRQKAGSFMTLCKTPELACEVTLQPLARFKLDAAILFSDILTIPDAMGLGLHFKEGEGPFFERPVRTLRDIKALGGKVPLIGFCGSPWTMATYMIEGRANKEFPIIRVMLKNDPQVLHVLLDTLAQSVAAHLNAQIKAGVQVVMIFDTWGGMLETADYQNFSLNYVKQIIDNLITEQNGEKIPVILFTKEGGQWLELMARSGCHALGVDWLTNIGKARERVGQQMALQGNMDPKILCQTPEVIRAEVAKILENFGKGSGHIFNLGHGITPDVPPDNVAVLVDAVHELSQAYHQQG